MKNPNAQALGSITSERKSEAARANGARGGRPKSKYHVKRVRTHPIHGRSWLIIESRPGYDVTLDGYQIKGMAMRKLTALRAQERGEK